MARGPKKHLKRLNAPSQWMLDKLSGIFAPRPHAGPHKLRECLPLTLILRNRLKYALSAREVSYILARRKIKVDGKVRTDPKFPAGFMDVVSIDDTNEKFRVLLDIKGRTCLTKVPAGQETRKLLRVQKVGYAPNRVPYASCHDGRLLRYPDPSVKRCDTVVFNTATNKIEESIRFKVGALAYITGGANTGRVGTIVGIEKHPGAFHIVHLEDSGKSRFATRLLNVFVIGRDHPLIDLPKGAGVRIPLVEDRLQRIESYARSKEGGGRKAKKGRH